MKKYSFLLAILFTFMLIGCGGGSDDSSDNTNATVSGDTNTTVPGNTYSIDTNSNNALMGPLKNATVKVYKLSDLNTSIEEVQTNNLGAFLVTLNALPDDEMLVVQVSGGEDIDANDDGIIDDTSTLNSGSIRSIAKASELKSGNVNVTLLSEVLYTYVEHLIGNVHQDDLEQALNVASAKLVKENINRAVVTYRDINNFIPMDEDSKNKLNFTYGDLVGAESFANAIHTDSNNSVIEEKLNTIFKETLSLRDSRLIEEKAHFLITLIQPINSTIASSGSDIFLDDDTNTSKLNTFVQKDANVTLTLTPTEDMKIIGWSGCSEISLDLKTCTLNNISSDTVIVPTVIYKETVYDNDVKDISEYFVTIDDNNYTISLDIDANATQKDFINSIESEDIIISSSSSHRFFREVESVRKVDDYNYIITTAEMSFLELYEQGGISLNEELSHENLVDDLATINRALSSNGSIRLLPPTSANDKEFVVEFGNPVQDSQNRGFSDSVGGEVTIADGVKVSGSLTYTLDTEFNYNIDWFELESMRFVVKKELKSELKITYERELHGFFKKKIKVGPTLQHRIPVPGAPLWINVSVALYIGYEGKIEAVATLTGVYSTVSKTGFNYLNGHVSVIDQNTNSGGFSMSGEVKTSVLGYVMLTPQLTVVDIAGAGVDTKLGVQVENSQIIGYSTDGLECSPWKGKAFGKLSAELRFVWSPFLNRFDWAQNVATRVNRAIEAQDLKLELAKTYTIKEWNTPCEEELPAFLELDFDPISETIFNDETLDKLYTLTIRNSGEKSLEWGTTKSSVLSNIIAVSPENGTLAKDESIEVLITMSGSDLTSMNGAYEGWIKFINKSATGTDAEVGNKKVNMELEVNERLLPPTFNSIALNGESIKSVDFSWSYSEQTVVDGFKIYKSNCSEDNYLLFETVSAINSTLNLNYDDYKNTQNVAKQLNAGSTYCFKMTSYKDEFESEVSSALELAIPDYATLVSSIKDKDNEPLPNANVRLTIMSNSSTSDGDGDYRFENLMPGRYLITVEAGGYTATTTEIELTAGETLIYEGQFVLDENLEGIVGTVGGKVRSATDNSIGISDVTIEIRNGGGNTTGDVNQTITSDENGDYTVDLESGTYTFQWFKNGYITDKTNVVAIGDETKTVDLSLSEVLTEGTMRTTLRWGSTPRDLDSHMVKKTDGTQDYHIYYSSKVSGSDSLDTDDTSSYGPETITLNGINTASVYTYYVYNYSGGGSEVLKNSGANVTVQSSEGSKTYYVPNVNGSYWKVYEIVNGVVTPCVSGCVAESTSTLVRSLNTNTKTQLFNNLPAKD